MLPPQRNKRLADGGYAKRIKEDVNIVDEMIECNRKNPDKVRECIRIGGGHSRQVKKNVNRSWSVGLRLVEPTARRE